LVILEKVLEIKRQYVEAQIEGDVINKQMCALMKVSVILKLILKRDTKGISSILERKFFRQILRKFSNHFAAPFFSLWFF